MPQSAEAKYRASRAYVLRCQGVTYREICDRLGFDTLEECFLAVAKLDGRDNTLAPATTKEQKAAATAEARKARRRTAAKTKREAEKQEKLAAKLVERYQVAS